MNCNTSDAGVDVIQNYDTSFEDEYITDIFDDTDMADKNVLNDGGEDILISDTQIFGECNGGICISSEENECKSIDYPIKTDIFCLTGDGRKGFCCILEIDGVNTIFKDVSSETGDVDESSSGCGCNLIK